MLQSQLMRINSLHLYSGLVSSKHNAHIPKGRKVVGFLSSSFNKKNTSVQLFVYLIKPCLALEVVLTRQNILTIQGFNILKLKG